MEIECFMVLKKGGKKMLKGSCEECGRNDDRGRVRSTVDKLPFSFQSVGKNKACSLAAIYFSSIGGYGNSIHQFGYNGYFLGGASAQTLWQEEMEKSHYLVCLDLETVVKYYSLTNSLSSGQIYQELDGIINFFKGFGISQLVFLIGNFFVNQNTTEIISALSLRDSHRMRDFTQILGLPFEGRLQGIG